MLDSNVSREEALKKAAQELDIAPSKYKQAMERFNSVGNYLREGEYEGTYEPPEIYLQGSFKLGTEIRPYIDSKNADYDIDIVCRLEQQKVGTDPSKVKHQVGDHLKDHGTYEKMLDDEGKRCWTLNYAEQDGVGFHMDILPSVQESWQQSDIAATNKCKDTDVYSWTTSNPKDFADWFYGQNRAAFDDIKQSKKQRIFDNFQNRGLFGSRDDVPDIHVKTPLQRVIQLLKRHRDIRFSQHENEQYKPISMIITILAARIYQNESTIYETLDNLIDTLSRHANQLAPNFQFNETLAQSSYRLIVRKADGTWHIPNPTNFGENFADRWHEDNHARAKAFFQWLTWAQEDFVQTDSRLDENHFTRALVAPDSSGGVVARVQPTASVFNVAHRQEPKWPMQENYSVGISAQYKLPGGWQNFSSRDQLSADCDLLFRANTNTLAPFDVFWQVVNTGKEAEDSGQLRGEIFLATSAGNGGLIQKERAEYVGTHWVQCFIVKNGICVAKSHEFIVRIQ